MKTRIVAAILALALICLNICTAAQAAVLRLPENLEVIRKEAFKGSSSIDEVVIPEGTTSIGERAFANSSVSEINLPKSLDYIADNAFEGCVDNLILFPDSGSYAHQWCKDHDILYQTSAGSDSVPAVSHAVHSVEYYAQAGESCFAVNLSSEKECTLVLEVLNDSGTACIDRIETPVEAEIYGMDLRLDYAKTMPKNYQLQAWLQDASGAALCAPCINIHHTQAYEDFMNQTPADYPAERVLDYGDSGYIVLADNVKNLGVNATAKGNDTYTFKTNTTLKAGDAIVVNVDGVQTPMKIGSITKNASGTVTVVEDQDVTLADLFNVVSISTYGNAGNDDTDGLKIPVFIPSTTLGDALGITVAATGMITVDVDVFYSSNLFQFDTPLFELAVSLRTEADMTVGVEGTIDTFEENNAPKIGLFNGADSEALPFKVPVTLAFSVNAIAEGGVEANVGIDMVCGIEYSTLNGFYSYVDGESDVNGVKLQPKTTAELYLGPELSLNLDIKKMVTARVGIHAGSYCRLSDPYILLSEDIKKGTEAYHACHYCVSGDTGLYIWPRMTAYAKLMKGLSSTPIDEGVPIYCKMGELYASVVNDEDSLFEGESHVDDGECPNWKYKTAFYTENANGEEESGNPITITGGHLKAPERGYSPYSTYLYPGNYIASTIFSTTSGAVKNFMVEDFAQLIFIEEEGATINGTILNNTTEEPVPGAHISLTGTNGKTFDTTSDANGKFLIENVPEGTYNYHITKQGFQDEELKGLKYTAGTTASIKIHLVPLEEPLVDEEIMKRIINHMGEDMVQQLKDARIALRGDFYHYVSPSGNSVLKYNLDLRSWAEVYEENNSLFTDARIAIVESGVFPLAEDEIAAAIDIIKNNGIRGSLELDNGFCMDPRSAISNDYLFIFHMDPRLEDVSYTMDLRRQWVWDEITYEKQY